MNAGRKGRSQVMFSGYLERSLETVDGGYNPSSRGGESNITDQVKTV